MKSKDTNPFEKIDLLIGRTAEPKGEEWFTATEYAEHASYSVENARAILAKLVKEGKLERWTGACLGSCGQKTKYRLK